jgi:arylsulfatase A-like enzyme
MGQQSISRRSVLKMAGVLGASAMVGGNVLAAEAPKRKPNIVFIFADDLGYGDLGCYGQEQIKTPALDQMAKQGMRFTDAYAGSTVSAPSRCCLMTGLHSGHALVRSNGKRPPLRESDLTVAELLKRQGYATALIGKWGLGEMGTTGQPNRKGFDYFYGYTDQRHAHNYYPGWLWRNEEKVYLRNEKDGSHDFTTGKATRQIDYTHDLFTAEALDWIEQKKDEPFFLYLAYTIPHANNEARNMDVPSDEPYADRDWPQQQKNKAAMITRMDGDVGKLLAKLRELGIDRDTLVIFTSDNGPHREGGADPDFFDSNGPLRGIKRDLYEGGIRVPAIAWWPGQIEAGTVSDLPWALWDFLPTAAAAAGAGAPAGLDGVSLLPTLRGEAQAALRERPLYWEFPARGMTQAVRWGKWKAIRFGMDKPVQLYDLSVDIGEQHDVAADRPEVAAKMARLMRDARTPSPHYPVKGE